MATQTTVTGLITDAGGNPATSGTVTFKIVPQSNGVVFRIAGTNVIAPEQVVGGISSSGQLLNQNLTGPLLVWGNPAILPANTTYNIVIAPNNVVSADVQGVLIVGTTYDLSNIQFAPITDLVPQQASIVANPFQTNILPSAGHVFNIGSQQLPYANIFADNITAASITGTLITPAFPFASLPAIPPSAQGTVATVTDTTGGLYLNSGTQWVKVFPLINVKDAPFNARGDGTHDDTAAIQAAYTAAAAANTSAFVGGATVYFPPGMYKTTSQITQTGNNIYTQGAGIGATQWLFLPTANGTCFQVSRPNDSDNTFGGISGISFYSTDTAFVKTALNLVAVAQFKVEDVAITGTATDTPGGAFYWGDTTKASIGIQTNGHQAIHLNRVTVWANRPILLGKDPFVNSNDTDLFNFENLFLVGGNAHPVIEAQQEIVAGSIFFGGYNDWIGGVDAFKWISTGVGPGPHTRPTIRFDNCRWESGQAGHHFNIQASGGDMIFDLTLRNCVAESGCPNGILLRNVRGCMIDTYRFFGTSGIAVDVDSSCQGLVFLGCAFTEQGATMSTTGFQNFLNFNKVLGNLGIGTFDAANGNSVFGGLHLPNLATINGVATDSTSKRLLFLSNTNTVQIDADAMGTVCGGALTASGTLTSTGALTASSTLSVTGVAAMNNNVTVAGNLSVGSGGTLTANGPAVLSGSVNATGTVTVSGSFTATAQANLNSNVVVGGPTNINNRLLTMQGSDVASAATITLGTGNVFQITGTTQINNIVTTNWSSGSIIILLFQSALTLGHAVGAVAGELFLRGAANLAVAAGTTHSFALINSIWYQVD